MVGCENIQAFLIPQGYSTRIYAGETNESGIIPCVGSDHISHEMGGNAD